MAAIQAEPVWNDLEGGVDKVISIIKEAGRRGVNVLGFPEVFIPGYPWYSGLSTLWLLVRILTDGRSIFAKSPIENGAFMLEYLQNSMSVDSPQMARICDAVGEAGLFVVLGYSERDRGSMYIAQVNT